VPLGTREEIVRGVRAALEVAVADPGALEAIGQRAKARVARMFTWDAKAGQVLEVYRWALGDGPRPDFGMPFRDPPT
jgi:glycosyltransferase involved in cell wall biosynthesis